MNQLTLPLLLCFKLFLPVYFLLPVRVLEANLCFFSLRWRQVVSQYNYLES